MGGDPARDAPPSAATSRTRRATPTVPRSHQAVLRVVGVGGAGVNAVNRMVEAQLPGVEFVAINTDLQSLQNSNADSTLHIGSELTRGLGSGSDPRVGYRAAYDEQDKIKSLLDRLGHGLHRRRRRRRHRAPAPRPSSPSSPATSARSRSPP